jgi:hypothetical protein
LLLKTDLAAYLQKRFSKLLAEFDVLIASNSATLARHFVDVNRIALASPNLSKSCQDVGIQSCLVDWRRPAAGREFRCTLIGKDSPRCQLAAIFPAAHSAKREEKFIRVHVDDK